MSITPEMIWVDVLILGAAIFGYRGMRTLISALRRMDDDDAPEAFYRGARGVVTAIGLVALAAGIWFDSRGMLIFGVVFLAEELYETLMAESVVRWGRKYNEPKE